jgi:L-threonylcarbamoyladenylate synthase
MQRVFEQQIERAAAILRGGGVVAFPTETVYGLGGGVFLEMAIRKIFSLKGRPSDNPLIVHIAHLSDLPRIAQNIPDEAYSLAERFWPGPLSIILQAQREVPSIVTGGLPTVAVRMPAHPIALELIQRTGQPIAAPSANLSGSPSATQAAHIRQDFGDQVTILDGGPSHQGIESTIIDLRNPMIPSVLRPGSISREEISSCLHCPVRLIHEEICPGTKYRHYAPRAAIRLFRDRQEMLIDRPKNCLLLMHDDRSLLQEEFYDTLRRVDLSGIEEVRILCDEHILENEGFCYRIFRASGINHNEPASAR